MAAESQPAASVAGGKVQGKLLASGEAVFLGIPYAQPPVGDLRWREPAPVKLWKGVRQAVEYASPCAQRLVGFNRPDVPGSEDCLYLNIWAPEWRAKKTKAVMFWIHGGANIGGAGSDRLYDGASLASHGVVVVTINYRLDVFGFLAHPELTRESAHQASGNYALMDQIAALKWVRDNISRFGGDPKNVTVFGESAGAMDDSLLMASPLAKGLFRRVIAESGTVLLIGGPLPLAKQEQAGVKLAESLKAPAGADAIKFLRGLPAENLLKAAAANGAVPRGLYTDVDGWVMPQPPAGVFAAGQQLPVGLMIGNNSREITPRGTAEALEKQIHDEYGSFAPQALQLYGLAGDRPADPDALYGGPGAQWATDTTFRCPAVAEAGWNSAAGQPTYEYQFDRAAPGREAVGAPHASELAYVFGTLGAPELVPAASAPRISFQPVDHEISEAMQQYWTNYAKTGDPNGGTLPAWPKFEPNSPHYIEFTDNGPVAKSALRSQFCAVYGEHLKQSAGH